VLVFVLLGVFVFLTQPSAPAQPPSSLPTTPRRLGEFSFIDRTGRTVTRADLAGKFVVVNFIHTGCSVSCLQVNERMAEVQQLVTGQDDVRLLSLTVDPRTDTPPVLAEFGNKFGADTNRWFLLTGDKALLYELIETSFLEREPLARTSPMPGGFLDVDRIAVVDRAGNVRRYFNGMKPATSKAVVEFLNQLRLEPIAP
jgi:protein SCO1/2